VLEALVEVWGPGRVGIRLSPGMGMGGCGETDPIALYGALVEELNRIGVAFVDVIEHFGPPDKRPSEPSELHRSIRARFRGAYLANGGYLGDSGRAAIEAGHADAIVFGNTFLANPDLPERIRRGAALEQADRATFYGGGAKGYIDYPTLDWALDGGR
jgi:N-ethylmaleimide reductase